MSDFSLTSAPIDPQTVFAAQAGGFVTFEGKVRNTHKGRSVVALEYEAYGVLAESEGQRLIDEAVLTFGLIDARAVHRTGRLEIGETAVWIGVAAPHRREAFAACEFIIDQIKVRVPIWKKEHYAEGDSGWIGCEEPDAASATMREGT